MAAVATKKSAYGDDNSCRPQTALASHSLVAITGIKPSHDIRTQMYGFRVRRETMPRGGTSLLHCTERILCNLYQTECSQNHTSYKENALIIDEFESCWGSKRL